MIEARQERDVAYCEENGFQPGTELYLDCLNDREQLRQNASIQLMQQGLRTMQGQ